MENESGILDLIRRGGIFVDVEGTSAKEVYKNICGKIKLPEGITEEVVYNALCSREDVLSTAVGNGIALPHARAPIVKNENDSMIVLVYLKNPIDMKAPDERPVTTMFILLTQNSQVHLKILSSLAALFRSLRFRKALEDRAGLEELSALIKDL